MRTTNKTAINATTDVNEIVFRGIIAFMAKQYVWEGTITNLTSGLNKVLTRQQRSILPGSPSAMRLVINRVVNRLRNQGIGVTFSRATDRKRTRFVRFSH